MSRSRFAIENNLCVVRFFDGNRWRLGVVYTLGPKLVSLLDVGRLRAVTLPKTDARHFRAPDGAVNRSRLARSILEHSACLKRQRIRHAGAVAKRVAAMLRKTA